MTDPKKKNLLLLGVAVVLLGGAALLAFRDSSFAGGDSTTPEVRAAVEDAAKSAAPVPNEPVKSNFHKRAQPVGGN